MTSLLFADKQREHSHSVADGGPLSSTMIDVTDHDVDNVVTKLFTDGLLSAF